MFFDEFDLPGVLDDVIDDHDQHRVHRLAHNDEGQYKVGQTGCHVKIDESIQEQTFEDIPEDAVDVQVGTRELVGQKCNHGCQDENGSIEQ